MKLISINRKKRFSEPVPPLKRISQEPQQRELSPQTKAVLVALAVTRTRNWSS